MNSNNIVNNVMWRFAEQISAQFVSFLVSIVLARLLNPDDYGTLALVMVFVNILQVFVDNGLGNGLIQKKDADDLDFSSVFWVNVVLCIILYLILFIATPYIANIWNYNGLDTALRVVGIIIVISGVKNILQAYVARNMMFKKFFWATLFGTICSAIVGITLAYMGFGIWALVAQKICNAFVDTVILSFTIGWRPKLKISLERVLRILPYSWKYTITVLVDVAYTNIKQLIIGKIYSTSDLAFFNQGEQFPQLIVSNINSSVDSVMFPAMSSIQDDKESIKEIAKRTIRVNSYILCPMMVGLAIIGEILVRIVLTDKWLSCVYFLRIQCFIYMLYPIATTNLNCIKALGRTDIFLNLEIIKIAISVVLMIATMRYGIKIFAIGLVANSLLGSAINMMPTSKLIGYSVLEQMCDFGRNVILASLMGALIYVLGLMVVDNIIIKLIVQVLGGIISYIALSALLRINEYDMIKNLCIRCIRNLVRG
jgi:O-antigen/teichoic acid export membrane protein